MIIFLNWCKDKKTYRLKTTPKVLDMTPMVFFQPRMNWRRRTPLGGAARSTSSTYELILPLCNHHHNIHHWYHFTGNADWHVQQTSCKTNPVLSWASILITIQLFPIWMSNRLHRHGWFTWQRVRAYRGQSGRWYWRVQPSSTLVLDCRRTPLRPATGVSIGTS